MKIIEIIPSLGQGGAERFTVDLCNELSLLGHDVALIVFHNLEHNGFYSKELSKNVELICMNKKKGVDLCLMFRLYTLMTQKKPDIVQTHLRAITYNIFSALFYHKAKYYHTVHSAADKEAGKGIDKYIRKIFFRHGYITPVTISENSQRSFIDFYGIDAPMIVNGRNVPAGLEISDDVEAEMSVFRRTPSTRVLVQLARMEKVKRHSMMARVVKRLSDEGFDLTLLMIGRTYSDCVNEIKALHCSNIHILGERHNPLEYLHEADAYCLCSSYEGMPISLIEALGMGAVPVCTPVGGIVNTIVDGKNGVLSTNLSEESYYAALKRFLMLDDEHLNEMKYAAKTSYASYSMTKCGKNYSDLFCQQ